MKAQLKHYNITDKTHKEFFDGYAERFTTMLLEKKDISKSPTRKTSNNFTSDTGHIKIASGLALTSETEKGPKFVIPKSRITFEQKANRELDTNSMRYGSAEV